MMFRLQYIKNKNSLVHHLHKLKIHRAKKKSTYKQETRSLDQLVV